MSLKVGDVAPDFTLPDHDGNEVTLSAFRGDKNVVLYFYPKDNTRVCTAESCMFKTRYEDIRGTDTEVFGISGDGDASHRGFRAKHDLPFALLTDAGHRVAKAYGAMMGFGLIPARLTFVIDKEGRIRNITDATLKARPHVEEAVQALSSLGQ